MAVSIVRLGSRRAANEGLRIGTVRRPPRGVRKEDYANKDLFDVWFPNLSPSEDLLKQSSPGDEPSWRRFRRAFLAEMRAPTARRDLELLAALSHTANFSIGCYCATESRCHRSILAELLARLGAEIRQSDAPTT